MSSERFASAIAAIDSANASDPNIIELRGRRGPKEVLHAELVTDWVISLRPDADELLLLAARGHHLRRWTVPRSSEPAGRAGYLRWRKGLHDQHARELGEIIERAGYDAGEVARVQALVRKSGLGRDADAQTLEDALCLVFLETQLSDVAARLDTATLARVIAKTTKKMSEEARARIGELPLDEGARRTLAAAQTYTPVHGYLEALARQDWAALAATLAPDIDRMGPYRDRFVGREPYVEFLADTFRSLRGYALDVARIAVDGPAATVELSETVDTPTGRLRTDEAVVFDTRDGLIARIAVYLQSSHTEASHTETPET